MTQTQSRDISSDLRAGKGHYVRLADADQCAKRIYRIKRTRTGEVSVYLGIDSGWTTLPTGKVIYSDRDTFHV